MKRLFTIFTCIFALILTAQKPIEKQIGEFHELKVYDLIEVELIKSTAYKIVISGENKQNLSINNKNGILKIKMNFKGSFDGNHTKVRLYYTSLDLIDVNEGARVYSNDVIKQFEVNLKSQEGGKIDVKTKVTHINIKSVTGGSIKVSGKTVSQDVSINTGGEYQGEALESKKCKVSVKAAGDAYVKASELVDVSIRAGGNVYIYGNPKTVNESKAFGGKIKRMK